MKTGMLPIVTALLLGAMLQAFAGDDASKDISPIPAVPPAAPAFRSGAQEVELLSGALFSTSGNTPTHPALNYAIEAVRYGWMFDDVHGSFLLRGSDEFLIEGFGGEVFTGAGRALGGGTLILRHNFVREGSRLVPYIQIGGGGLDNDIYRDQYQRRIGERFEFMLHGGLGVRFMLSDHWAVSTEAEFRHISDADLAGRNGGLDSIGATLGLNFLF